MRLLALVAAILFAASGGETAEPESLALETKIMLGDVKGRIDHLSADPRNQRLFIAELGNNSVGVIDLKKGKVALRIGGLREPQGVGYLPATHALRGQCGRWLRAAFPRRKFCGLRPHRSW